MSAAKKAESAKRQRGRPREPYSITGRIRALDAGKSVLLREVSRKSAVDIVCLLKRRGDVPANADYEIEVTLSGVKVSRTR